MPIFLGIPLAVDRIILGSDAFYDTLYQSIRDPFSFDSNFSFDLPFFTSFGFAMGGLGIGLKLSDRFRRIALYPVLKIVPHSLLHKCLRIGENIFSNDIIRYPMSHVAGKISALYTRIRG